MANSATDMRRPALPLLRSVAIVSLALLLLGACAHPDASLRQETGSAGAAPRDAEQAINRFLRGGHDHRVFGLRSIVLLNQPVLENCSMHEHMDDESFRGWRVSIRFSTDDDGPDSRSWRMMSFWFEGEEIRRWSSVFHPDVCTSPRPGRKGG